MSSLLSKLGSNAAAHPWRFIIGWLVILAITIGGFAAFRDTLKTSFDVPGTASGEVIDHLTNDLPQMAGGSGSIVYQTADGKAFTDLQKERISGIIADAGELPGVTAVIDPFATTANREQQIAQLAEAGVAEAELSDALKLATFADSITSISADGSTAVVAVSYKDPVFDMSKEVKDATIEHFTNNTVTGTTVEFSASISQENPELFGIGEMIGLAIAAIVLIVMLRSLLAAALPLITALVGVGIGVALALSFSGLVDMASITPILGVMLGLAVGIDYALFIVNRHRKQVLSKMPIDASISLAVGTSGTAVIFAGATVIIALLALNVTGIPFLGLMGTVGAVCVAIAALISVTLTPALLSLIGPRVLSRRKRKTLEVKANSGEQPQPRPMKTARAVLTSVTAIAVLLALAIPALSMRVGLPDSSSDPQESTSYKSFTTIAKQFGEGANGPLLIAADVPDGLADKEVIGVQVDIATILADLPNVAAIAPIGATEDNTLLAFQLLPNEGPNSTATEKLVEQIRTLPPINDSITLAVAGQAAINIDISEAIVDVLPLYLCVVIGLSLIIMVVVFRSLLVPLIATGGFMLSLFATFGLIVALFQFGWGAELIGVHNTGPILSFLPVLLVGILFGLAMDYQLFLASGMREAYVHGTSPRIAVTKGLHAGRAVVIAAGLIMISVFGGFIFTDATIIRSIGFGLAFGVLLDAFVVRLLIMPALMHLLGASAWWLPRWLDRILPQVDIEGATLQETTKEKQP